LRERFGDVPIAVSAVTLAELVHGIHRADTPRRAAGRRRFADELRIHLPIHPIGAGTAEIIGRVGAELDSRGAGIPPGDLAIAATALELQFAVVTGNLRHFERVAGLVVVEF
jgi:predicted nucleic acid-binding protein